ncbi:MAG: outer membrane lipoprotein carrier protein LolA [Phaeodactylibacter sp.]|nr:outer membrane lipoprotein carrier protein LolA [Phaeodactylibacter sp.]MCB9048021.1 outer membrane lipoprotein carrier protein LolA [Lewinellaceae bacterium]
MKKLLLVLMLFTIAAGAYAQTGNFTSADESDPKAKAILEEIRKRFLSYKSLGADFTLDITLADEPTETQKGSLSQQGKKYRVEMGSQSVISDGNTLWLILSYNKEVQINDMPEEGEMDGAILSPDAMLNFYDKGDFVYYLTNEYKEGARTVQQIEFKPMDRNADYSKLRMNVNKATKDIISVEAFAKDGSRYKLSIDKLYPNKAFAANYFTFDKAKYPGYYIEDLRE